jgi:hypothetical protein
MNCAVGFVGFDLSTPASLCLVMTLIHPLAWWWLVVAAVGAGLAYSKTMDATDGGCRSHSNGGGGGGMGDVGARLGYRLQ